MYDILFYKPARHLSKLLCQAVFPFECVCFCEFLRAWVTNFHYYGLLSPNFGWIGFPSGKGIGCFIMQSKYIYLNPLHHLHIQGKAGKLTCSTLCSIGDMLRCDVKDMLRSDVKVSYRLWHLQFWVSVES